MKRLQVWFKIRKENGKYSKAVEAFYHSWSKSLELDGKRLTLRGTLAYYHVKTFKNVETVEQAEQLLQDLGFKILVKEERWL